MAMLATPLRVLTDHGPIRVELARWQGQLVVLKRLRLPSPSLAERLKREAAVLKKLRHDNIVPLLAAEEDTLVYAYCPGVSLADSLEEGGALRVARAAAIATGILQALDYAHGVGVIHFDVKPSNILIKGEKALLTDFGFAKDLGLTAITQPGIMLGTPNYMAPEQFRGDRSDPRSDLYSVGAVLYHMVTGAPPYGNQVLRFLAGDDRLQLAPLPAQAAPLAGIISTALSRSPEARFDSAAVMQGALADAAKL
ncbi:MAG TPA: serine/threonine-protein kinase [Trueperaceae bacterium]